MAKTTKQAAKSKKTRNKAFSSRRFAYGLCALSAVLLLGSLWSWWHFVHSSSANVFYGAISNSLKSTGSVRNVSQKQEAVEIKEETFINTAGPHVVNSQTSLTQSGTNYDREAVGTPEGYYVRYNGIQTSEKNNAGQPHDFSQVLKVWGKADKEAGGDQYYNEVTLLNVVVPAGNLSADNRTDLMNQIKDDGTYQFDKNAVRKSIENGRPTYTYDVTVDLEQYIKTVKKFASHAGISTPQLESADPASYKGQPALKFTFKVDAWSRQLTEVNYNDNGRIEKTSSYGLRREVEVPAQTIDINELQKRLQKLE